MGRRKNLRMRSRRKDEWNGRGREAVGAETYVFF